MTRADAVNRLSREAPRLRRLGVRELYLFGSTVRDEATDASDVDLFVEEDSARFGLIELAELQEEVSSILGTRADVTTRQGLHPLLRPRIEAEALRIF
ncbi:nucleotidyltransferase family protein [Enterovirga sp. CN4-39]|uniref:nucleotidyltransferase family protein n=1 Tax=Enterovirga sp. CN4-39 TaxID=3400910 RepID=UPI003C08BF5E